MHDRAGRPLRVGDTVFVLPTAVEIADEFLGRMAVVNGHWTDREGTTVSPLHKPELSNFVFWSEIFKLYDMNGPEE